MPAVFHLVIRALKSGSLTLIMAGCAAIAMAQKGYHPINLGGFDKKQYHFGFLLGFNSADYYLQRSADSTAQQGLLSVNTQNQPGFNLGIIASLNFTKNISLRFLPTLSFEDRSINYVFASGVDSTVSYEKRVESTFLDFPLNVKFRTDRLNNFAAYALAGARYRVDMQSQKDVRNELLEEVVVRTQRNDFAVEVGAGLDFFLPYFKFGLEFKVAMGLPNVLLPEATQFTEPLESLRSRAFLLSLTFEG